MFATIEGRRFEAVCDTLLAQPLLVPSAPASRRGGRASQVCAGETSNSQEQGCGEAKTFL